LSEELLLRLAVGIGVPLVENLLRDLRHAWDLSILNRVLLPHLHVVAGQELHAETVGDVSMRRVEGTRIL
jgi:hypothetical protein